MNNILQVLQNDCCGCGACSLKCPKNCITMNENAEGFLYPYVDKNICVECGLCLKTCPIMQSKNVCSEKVQKSVILQDLNKNYLKNSTSGGAFACIARFILAQNGVVVGVAYDDLLNVKHIAIESEAELYKLQGSKYVESKLNDIYIKVQKFLKEGRKVLFSGTPCQVAGLKLFLKSYSDLLLTIDVVCHGTPSQKLFKKYIEWLSKGNSIEWYCFRSKIVADWGLTGAYFDSKKIKIIRSACDPYFASFLRGDTYKKSCYNCKFANLNRSGDFTIGDFWGYNNMQDKLDFDYKKGLSVVFINTGKANNLMNEISKDAKVVPVELNIASSGQENLFAPTKLKPIRDKIYSNIDLPFEKLKKFMPCENLLLYKIRRLRRTFIPKKIRNFITKFFKEGII